MRVARHAAFALVHTALVGAYVAWLCDALPPLHDEPLSLVLAPVVAIACVAFAAMYPLVRRARSHLVRLAILVAFTAVGVLAFPLWLIAVLPPAPEPLGLALFVVVAELLYGAPMFALVALAAKLLSPLLVARPATSWV